MRTFRNPVIPGFYPDPSICRVGEDYWLATSSFEYWPSLPLFHSRDLVHWQLVGHTLTRPSQLDLTGRANSRGLFAPTLRYHDGTFYLICTDVGGRGNFIVTATEVAGPWSDSIWIEETDRYHWFDPSLLFDDDGKVYYTRREAMQIWQAEIDPTNGQLLSEFRHVLSPLTSDDIEGPHLYKIKGTYYLMVAEGGTGWGHRIACARASSPWGPFEACPHNPLLTHSNLCHTTIRSTGHGDLIEAHDGSWWMCFLGTRHGNFGGQPFHHLGRDTYLAPVQWKDGWPVLNEGQPIREETIAPAFCETPQSVEAVTEDDFSSEQLGRLWTYRRACLETAFSLHERPQHLRIRGAATTLHDAEPEAFVGQRLDQPFFQLSVHVDFAPAREGEQAGLALVMADDCFVTWMIEQRAGEVWIVLQQQALTLRGELCRQQINPGPWQLSLSGNWEGFRFSVRDAAGQTLEAPFVDRRLLSTEFATGWTGLFAGLYATGQGQPAQSPADFSHFVHRRSPLPLSS